MDYYKLSFPTDNSPETADILAYELGEIGFESFDENENTFNAYVQKDLFNQESLNEICERYKSQINMNYEMQLIPTTNWNAAWESTYQPIEIENILRIRASFHEPKPGFEHEIVIVPKMSFGTGHHDTTQLVAKAMRLLELKNKRVLDMGCGTGILAIYAEKLGASQVHAIDIEDFAYENTLENVALNGCSSILVDKGGAEKITLGPYTVILANINKNILLQQIPTYGKNLLPGGVLLLSGFFESDAPDLINACKNAGMEFASKYLSNNWTCLQFLKPALG
ncbi:MAG TPA: 50S ribosomal protein L11 methyltransferase [Flavobacteriales bacterium]|nr:50S ribosomal protein L11 methyltransferase [Flavobacteriales bacterium]